MSLWQKAALVALALGLWLDDPGRAGACGGPEYADLGALEPVDATIARIVVPDAYSAVWGNAEREEMRFLYPLKQEHPELAPLWDFAHESKSSLPGPSVSGFESAIRAGDRALAEREARALVNAVLDLPAAPGAEHAPTLWRAIEYLELAPKLKGTSKDVVRDYFLGPMPSTTTLGKTLALAADARVATPGAGGGPLPAFGPNHPRVASLSLWKLLDDFRVKVPNGWSDAVRKHAGPNTFKDLEKDLDRWMANNSKHPARDFALLWKVRIRWFAGDGEGAWQVLFDMYPRHRARVAGEMRYLLLQGEQPTRKQVDALTDPVLIAALAGPNTIDETRFERWWKLADANLAHAWAVNLEERLLLWAARTATPSTLPASFPSEAKNPTVLWGKLRAAALLRAHRWDEAKAELASLQADPERSLLYAQYHLAKGRPDLAAEVEGANPETTEYLARARGRRRARQAGETQGCRILRVASGARRATGRERALGRRRQVDG